MNGWDPLGIQCIYVDDQPRVGGPYLEDSKISGNWTQFPFGIDCTYDSPTDDFGPQTVSHPDWPATITFGIGLGGVFGGVALANRGDRRTQAEREERKAATRRRLGME